MPTFETVREIGGALPGTVEGTSYGTAALKVQGKLYARLKEDGESLVVMVEAEAREEMLAAEPEIYYITEHYRNYPWVLVRLVRVHPDALRDLLGQAWRLAGGKRKSGAH